MIFHSDNSHKDSGLQYLCSVSDSMNILWVAATAKEVSLSGLADPAGDGYFPEALGPGESLLVTGVGMVATAFSLGQILSKKPVDLVVNFGLAGSLSAAIHPGDLVEVTEEEFGDLGAEDRGSFLDVFQLGLVETGQKPWTRKSLMPIQRDGLDTGLRKVKGTTVNTVHGEQSSIAAFTSRTSAEVESMEGAAIFYACGMLEIPCLQIRAISNYVEPRDRSSWKIAEAMKALADYLPALRSQITKLYS
jgi:futalosine hydrolase